MTTRSCFPARLLNLWFYFTVAGMLAFNPSINAQGPNLAEYEVPADMSGVHFYLITVDVGDSVWDNFGHTALRVFDESNNSDTVFSWGYFSLSGGPLSFSWNFFKGIMNYSLVTNPTNEEFSNYRIQERTVWQDRINLTNPQKEQLYRRLMWNLEPANVEYAYQYFFDNCTTRVRDYLDEALSGRISRQYVNETNVTFRDQVQAHYESVGIIAFSLDILMNSNIDRKMTEWEDMFLPLQFRERLLQVRSDVAENGKLLMLLSDSQVIIEYPSPTADSNPYQLASLVLVPIVLLMMLMLKRIPQSYYATHSRIGFRVAGINFRILGLLGLVTAVFSGIYGILMMGSWFVSDNIDTHHNVNLLLFWPTDLLAVVVALRWLFLCKPWPMTSNSAPFINYYLLAHVLAIMLHIALAFFGLVAQSITNVALYVVPGVFLFTLLIWLVGFEPARPKNTFF